MATEELAFEHCGTPIELLAEAKQTYTVSWGSDCQEH
jgi:hypothetical protein